MRDIAHIDELLAAEEEGKVDKEKSLLQAREDLARLEREQGEQVGEEEVEAEVGRLRRREKELGSRGATLGAARTDLQSKNRLLSKQQAEVGDSSSSSSFLPPPHSPLLLLPLAPPPR